MRVLIDTNVLLDSLIGREPYFEYADRIINLCARKRINGFMAAHSIPNIFYILRKDMTEESRRDVILNLCNIIEIEGIDADKIKSALNKKEFSDFEDCLQSECAYSIGAEYIITRNVRDFSGARVQVATPVIFYIGICIFGCTDEVG